MQLTVGLAAGVTLGLVGWLFKFIERYPYTNFLKCFYCIGGAVGLIVSS